MAKLYFRYGSVGSAKTLNLLAVAHNYRQQGKKILLLKPLLDSRFGAEKIKSRSGLETKADILLKADSDLFKHNYDGVSCVLVDEAQFLSSTLIDQLREIATNFNIPVICYGLRSDFRTHLFEGSRRLFELADAIEEVKSTCHYCNKKAIMNLKHVEGKPTIEGASIDLGAEEKYFPTCFNCYQEKLELAGLSVLEHNDSTIPPTPLKAA